MQPVQVDLTPKGRAFMGDANSDLLRTLHALQVTAGMLAYIAEHFKLDERTVWAKFDRGIGEFNLGQALDLADAALGWVEAGS